jgi:hypothetical protein
MQTIIEAILIAIYWFIGGYLALALTPWAYQAGWGAFIIGLLLYIRTERIEANGQKIPFWLGGLLLGSPVTLMFIGAVGLVAKWLGLLW